MAKYSGGINTSVLKQSCISILLSVLVALMCCTPSPEVAQEPPLQETKYFNNFTLDEIWTAVLSTVDELEYTIQKEIKESGFIYAQAKTNPDPKYLPPHMNVYVRKENGRIRVNCHAVIPGQETNLQASSAIVKKFFTALAFYLTQ